MNDSQVLGVQSFNEPLTYCSFSCYCSVWQPSYSVKCSCKYCTLSMLEQASFGVFEVASMYSVLVSSCLLIVIYMT